MGVRGVGSMPGDQRRDSFSPSPCSHADQHRDPWKLGRALPVDLCSCTGRRTSPCGLPPACNISPASGQLSPIFKWAAYSSGAELHPHMRTAMCQVVTRDSTCTVLFNCYHKYGMWFYHYHPDIRDEKTEVIWPFPNHRVHRQKSRGPMHQRIKHLFYAHVGWDTSSL